MKSNSLFTVFTRLLLIVGITVYLGGCSNGVGIAGITGSSAAVRVSVLGGSPLPQVADNVRSVDTGRLKVYVMDGGNPYRENVVQEIDMSYRVPAVAEGKRLRVASTHRRVVVKDAIKRAPVVTEIKQQVGPTVTVYKGGESSKIVTLPSKTNLPVKVAESPLQESVQPRRQKNKLDLSEYQAVLNSLKGKKIARHIAPKKRVVKSKKKRAYNYYKKRIQSKGKKNLKRSLPKRKLKNKNLKKKWKWDSEGHLLRV